MVVPLKLELLPTNTGVLPTDIWVAACLLQVLVAAQQALEVLMVTMPPLRCVDILAHKLPSETATSSGTAVDGEVLCATIRSLQVRREPWLRSLVSQRVHPVGVMCMVWVTVCWRFIPDVLSVSAQPHHGLVLNNDAPIVYSLLPCNSVSCVRQHRPALCSLNGPCIATAAAGGP